MEEYHALKSDMMFVIHQHVGNVVLKILTQEAQMISSLNLNH